MSIRYVLNKEDSSSNLIIGVPESHDNDINQYSTTAECYDAKCTDNKNKTTTYPTQEIRRRHLHKSESLHSSCRIPSLMPCIPHSSTFSSQGIIDSKEFKVDKNINIEYPVKCSSDDKSRNTSETVSTNDIKIQDGDIESEVMKRGPTSYYDPDAYDEIGQEVLDENIDIECIADDKDAVIVKTSVLPRSLSRLLITLGAAFIGYLFLNLSPYQEGILVGTCAALTFYVISKLLYESLLQDDTPPFTLMPLTERKPPLRRRTSNTQIHTSNTKLQGWMNEVTKYTPESYKVKKSYSTFITLMGRELTLRRSINKLSNSGNIGDTVNVSFSNKERVIPLTKCSISLLPAGLVRKRLWSKKYPICLTVAVEVAQVTGNGGVEGCFYRDVCTDSKVATGNNTDDRKSSTTTTTSSSASSNHSSPKHGPGGDTVVDHVYIYLFGRSDRNKEEWYHRLYFACNDEPLPVTFDLMMKDARKLPAGIDFKSKDNIARYNKSMDASFEFVEADIKPHVYCNEDLNVYLQYMASLVPEVLGRSHVNISGGASVPSSDANLLWLNAFLARATFDLFQDERYALNLKTKLNKKLAKMHIPKFLNKLVVKELSLGTAIPLIRRCAHPTLDERGLWTDIDITYNGGFTMVIETQIDILNMNRKYQTQNTQSQDNEDETIGSAIYDSNEEDSGESSTDEEDEDINEEITCEDDLSRNESPENDTCKKDKSTMLQIIDNLANSRIFNAASENRFVKGVLGELANTSLQLQVEMKSVDGTMTLNIPTAPSDRFWYGFKEKPKLWLNVTPKFGMRSVSLTWITGYIKRKLKQEFNRHLVLPNMNDEIISILNPHIS